MAALTAMGVALIASAGCAPKVASTGQKLADPSQPLQTALDRLKKDNYAGIQNNSITVSSATECFYILASKDAKGISDQAVCGPIRRLGLSDDQVWDRYQLTFKSDGDGNAVATVGGHTAQGVSVDTGLLISPAGDKPAAATDLPAPQAPQTSVTDRAVAVAENATPAGLTFTPPGKPVKLITPAATITVTGVAQPRNVPGALVAGQNDPAGKAAYYRPAPDQKLYAYQLQISKPPDAALPAATAGSTQIKDPSTSVELRAGTKTVPISDQTGTSNASSTLNIPCAASGSAAYPCKPRTTKITILATVPATGPVSVSAVSAGAKQSVDLGTGAVESTVSTIEYDRTQLTSKIGKRLKTGPYRTRLQVPAGQDQNSTRQTSTGQTSNDQTSTGQSGQPGQKGKDKPKIITAEARWSMKVGSISLAGYDPTLGWAPKGQAWLIVSTSKYKHKEFGATFTDHRAESLTATVDNAEQPVKAPTDAELAKDAGADVNWTFAVPDDATTATISFRPTGTVSADGVSAGFTSDQTDTLQVDLPH